jgi:hypothetical protein
MALDAIGDDDRIIVAGAVETIHVGFGPHHVVVHSAVPAVSDDLRRAFGPMQIDGPAGIEAGAIDVTSAADGVSVHASAAEEGPRIVDPDWAPREVYHEAIKLLMRVRTDLVWIHAGVAAWQGRAFLFVGPSGQGKSTLVAALLERGWSYFSDEIGAIDAETGCALPFPLLPRRRVHDGALLPPEDLLAIRRLPKVDVEFSPEAIGRQPLPIARICFLRFEPKSTAVSEQPVTPAESVLDLLRNSLALEPDRKREIASLAQLVGRVPSARLSYPSADAAAAWVHDAVVANAASA